jgi:hypothetical protein
MKKVIIGVMGPGRSATETDMSAAYELGGLIARENWIVLSGGMSYGVMDAVSCGAKAEGGLTLGIVPMDDLSMVSAAIDIPIITDMGSARNNINVLSSHVIIACGMSAGTASEVALALRAGKKVILLNATPESQAFFSSLASNSVIVAKDPNEVIAIARDVIQNYQPAAWLEEVGDRPDVLANP